MDEPPACAHTKRMYLGNDNYWCRPCGAAFYALEWHLPDSVDAPPSRVIGIMPLGMLGGTQGVIVASSRCPSEVQADFGAGLAFVIVEW